MITMFTKIEEIDNVILSLTETFSDIELTALKIELLKNVLKHTIKVNSEKGLGITINDVYFTHGIRYDFDKETIAVIYDVKCIGLINYTDIKSWS